MMSPHFDGKVAEIFGVVFAQLLNPFALVHSALRVRVSRQVDCSAAGHAELQIKAHSIARSVFQDQH